MRYVVEHRYQDSGWEPLGDARFDSESAAVRHAELRCRDAICVGMTQVVDTARGKVVATFPAGGPISASALGDGAIPAESAGPPADDAIGPYFSGRRSGKPAPPNKLKALLQRLIDRLPD